MSKILFYFPALEKFKPFHYMPISALSVSAELLAQGHEVEIFDERVDGELYAEKMTGVKKFKVSAYTGYQLSRAYAVSKWVKENFPDVRITWGGPHATALPAQTLASPYVDEVVQGEVDTGEHPLPYWLIDIEKYVNPETKRFIAVTSYGCVGQCTFCQTKNRRKFLPLPLDRVEADIDYLMEHYKWREVVFFDATLFSVPERVHKISNIMTYYDLDWIADARAPEIAKLDYWDIYAYHYKGLRQLTIGLESGSPRIIEAMKKGKNHLENFKLAAEKLKDFPLKMVSGVVFGCPGETVEDLRLTVDYIKRIKEINPNFFISTTFFRPLPDTEMTDICIKEYGYKQPDTLQGWAELGQENHYNYNAWADSPWIAEPDEYRKIYEQFQNEYKELFI